MPAKKIQYKTAKHASAKPSFKKAAPRMQQAVLSEVKKAARRVINKQSIPNTLSTVGTMAGNMMGGPLAGKVLGAGGSALGGIINKITGLGDYTIEHNSIAGIGGDPVPAVINTHTGVRICHREYIQDVDSSIGFTNIGYSINPGVINTFPWLSAIAQNFQQYKFHGLVFTFVSTSADALNSTNTALGTVIMATNYNAFQNLFQSKSQMENNEFTTSGKPSVNIMHMIECDPKQTIQEGKFYIRTGALGANQDIKTYDQGLFQLATVGSQAISTIGELHVSYDIEFFKPTDIGLLGNNLQYAHYYCSGVAITTAYFGSSRVARIDNIGLNVIGNLFIFPVTVQPSQVYKIDYMVTGSVVATPTVTPTLTLANCTLVSAYLNGSASGFSDNGTSLYQTTSFIISISNTVGLNTPAQVTFSVGTLPTGTVTAELYVSQIPSNIQ
nr:MAG: capsid protein [Cressdnaviricota sp.]